MTSLRAAAVLIAVCACLLLVWGVSTWREFSSLAQRKRYDCLRPDPTLLLRATPGCEGELTSLDGTSSPFRTNREGAYHAEVGPRRAGVTRLLVLGDSLLVPFDNSASVLRRLERTLAAEKVEVINGAQPGYTLPQIRLWARELVRAYRPDAVLLVYEFFSWDWAPATTTWWGPAATPAAW